MAIENSKLADEKLPAEFGEAIDGLALGLFSIEQVRAGLSALLQDSADSVTQIHETLSAGLRDGRISDTDYETLSADVDRLVSEDAPTEWSRNVDAFIDVQRQAALKSLGGAQRVGTVRVPPRSSLAADSPGPAPEKVGPGTVLRNRFRLDAHVEAGSMGEIYKAVDFRKLEADSTDPTVAIKVISEKFSRFPNALKALQQEAANGQRLSHPNIVRVFDFDRHGNHFYMTMEWLEGESLVSILNAHRFRPLPFDKGTQIIEGICNGLIYAHKQGVVHADIKPGNVFITHHGEVKLLDFGIARAGHSAPGGFDPAVIGAHTPAYSSCEVLEGQVPTERDDVYSLACIAYRIFAGRRAFSGFTALESESHGRMPKPIETLSSGQWQALLRAMAYRREDRTPDVATFLKELSSAPRAEPEPVKHGNDELDDLEYEGASRMPFILGGAASLAIIAAVAVSLWPQRQQLRDPAPQPAAATAVPTEEQQVLELEPLEILETVTATSDEAAAELPAEPDALTTDTAIAEVPPAEPAEQEDFMLLAQQRMDEGLLVEPAGDSAMHYLRLVRAQSPDSGASRQGANRLANLMMLEAMIAISDKNFSLADRWLARANELDAERDVTTRVARELAKARDAERKRESEAFATVFASTTPTAVLAGQNADLAATTPSAKTPASSTPKAAEARAPQTPAQTTPNAGGGSADAKLESVPAPDSTEPVAPEPAAAATNVDQAADPIGEVAQLPTPAAGAESITEPVAPAPITEPEPTVEDALAARRLNIPEAPTPVPEESDDIQLSELEFKRFVEPKYPRGNAIARKSGWVELRFRVNTDGAVDDVQIVSSEPAGVFDSSATRAVSRWRFKPRLVNGVPTATYSGVRLRFDGTQ